MKHLVDIWVIDDVEHMKCNTCDWSAVPGVTESVEHAQAIANAHHAPSVLRMVWPEHPNLAVVLEVDPLPQPPTQRTQNP